MFQFRYFLALFSLIANPISSASAKTLTEAQARAAASRIDSLLEADLKIESIKPNARIDDGTFVRRAYLGIIGRIPTETEAMSFFDNSSQTKRADLIDSLTASPGFDSHLFNWTADLLRVQTAQEQFGLGWHVWLRQSLAENKPWDELVSEMLSATGHTSENPAVGYYLRDRNMQLDNFSNSMQVFLGRQIGCAQCHDHPFDDWSQLEYYQMAAFGGGFQYRSNEALKTANRVSMDFFPKDRKKGKNNRDNIRKEQRRRKNNNRQTFKMLRPLFKDFNKNEIVDNPDQFLRLPEDYQYSDGKPNAAVEPETLFGEKIKNIPAENRREAFAQWITSPENPYFTKVIANRLWARTFGHGLVDPVDDWTEDSKAAHPEVLAFLETTMKAVDYDLRQFCRVLFLTNLFQLECDITEPQPGTAHLIRGPALQRMTAEQLYDSMIVLTKGEIDDSPRAANLQKWESYTTAVKNLVNTDSKTLIAKAQSASKAEAKFRKSQSTLRTLQSAIKEAKTPEEREEIYQTITKERETMNFFRTQSDPLSAPGMGMQMMMNQQLHPNSQEKSVLRASEMPAPFKPGTLVREFGGSDRASPSSGETIPTVPQALALLNDPKIDIIGNKKHSNFAKRLFDLESPGERLDLVFLRLYSRPPGEEDRNNFESLARDETTLRDLTRAMLTSNRFIFIQ